MEKNVLTNEESLRIITSMINQAKVNVRNSSFHLLFWGWLIFICSLSDYILYQFFDYTNSYYVWLFVVPGIFVSMIYGFRNGRKSRISTYADSLYMWLWIAFMITAIILFVLMMDRPQAFGPFMLLLAGFPTFMSGIILKFKPLVVGGLIFWLLSLISNFLSPEITPLAMPLAVITGYLIPGYLLKIRNSHGDIQ